MTGRRETQKTRNKNRLGAAVFAHAAPFCGNL